MEKQNLKYRLLADLLATLKAEEFDIGIGKHLDLQALLSKLPEDIEPEEMRTLLSPIFAKNKQDQAYFYDLFNQSLARAKAKTWQPKEIVKEEIPPVEKLAWWMKLLGGLLLASILAGLFFIKKNSDPIQMPSAYYHSFPVELDSSYTFRLQEFYSKKDSTQTILTDTSSILYVSFLDGQTLVVDSTFGTYQIDSLGKFTLGILDSTETSQTSITVLAKYHMGWDTTVFTPYVIDNEAVKPKVERPVEEVESDTLSLKSHPYPKSLTSFFPPEPPQWKVFFQKYHIPIKVFLSLLLIAIFALWARWWKERNQQIVADIQSKTDPPLLWNIEIPNVGKLGLNESYFQVLNQMRQRTNDDHFVLNIPKTIDKTIEQAGVVDFQYQFKTRPPEYLLLIDRQSSKNHRAHLYDYLYQNFKANEVYIERFFYEGDIRLCWNEYYPNGIKLTELQQSHRESRLIIIGSGYQMLNPTNGKLAKWTRYFDGWSDKAILTPRPTQQWGGREKQLKQKFILLPASIQSLTVMVDKMEAIDPEEIKTKITDDINEPIEFRGNLIETLHHYFSIKKNGKIVDDRLVQWIAACAIYPTLHWDLTMYLGQELSDEDHNILTVDNVIQLTRLPWFIDGKIPEQARLELLEYLPNETELHLRKSLQQLFDTTSMPDESSVAYSDARMNIALNEYLLEKNPRLKKEYEQYLRAGTEADVTMLKYLEGDKAPQDFEVDQSWRKFAQGKQADLEPDNLTKYLGFGVLALIFGLMFYNPTIEGCQGELVMFGDNELCIENPREQLVLREFEIREMLKNLNSEIFDEDLFEIDSIEKLAVAEFFRDEIFEGNKDTLDLESLMTRMSSQQQNIIPLMDKDTSIIHFHKNISVDYYNEGVGRYNALMALPFEQFSEFPVEELNIEICELFGLAVFYEGQISAGEISRTLNPILKKVCNAGGEEEDLILVEEVGGRVYDSKSMERVKDVEVEFFGKKDKTNSRGRYLFQVPTNSEEFLFPITFKKEGYQDFSKNINRSKLETFLVQPEIGRDLDDVFLVKIDEDPIEGNSEYDEVLALIEEDQKSKKYASAVERLKNYLGIDAQVDEKLTSAQKDFLQNKIKDLKREAERNNFLVDDRGAKPQQYKTVFFWKTKWMAENLNYESEESNCYDDNEKNCDEHGRLYSISTRENICPKGWRIPSIADFLYLFSKNGLNDFEIGLDGEEFTDETGAQKLYARLAENGTSKFNWKFSGAGEEVGSKIKYGGKNEIGGLLTSSFIGDQAAFAVIGNERKKQTVLINSSADLVGYLSCRCVKGPKPDESKYKLSSSSSEDSGTPQAPPIIPVGKKMTLEIEVVDLKTYAAVSGSNIEIEEDKTIKINALVRSGHRYTAEVEEGKVYTLIVSTPGYKVTKRAVLAKAEPKRNTQKITIKLQKAIAQDDVFLVHPSLLPYLKDILAYYPFDGNAKDVVKSNDAIAVIGATPGLDNKGREGRSFYFDGKESRIELPKIIDTEDRFLSISFWVKRISADGAIFGQYTKATGKEYVGYKNHIYLTNERIGMDDYPPLGGNKDNLVFIPKNAWTHVVMVRRPGLELIYINGKLERQGEEKEFFNKEWGDLYNIVLGARPQRDGYNPQKSFNGWIDELIIFENSLRENEVKILFDINK